MVRLGDEQWAQGVTLYNEGRIDDAIAVWREALRLNPNHSDARFNSGVALSDNGHSKEAVAEWCETVRRHPDFWQAHERLGSTFLQRARKQNKRKDWRAARDAYERSLAVRPGGANMLYWFGVMEWKSGNRRGAIAALQQAIKADSTLEQAYLRLGRYQWRTGH